MLQGLNKKAAGCLILLLFCFCVYLEWLFAIPAAAAYFNINDNNWGLPNLSSV
jgi:hypothetical protein